MVQPSHPYMTTGKTIALTRCTFVGKIMSLLFNMLCRLVITFLPRSKHLLISWLQSPSAVILGPPKNEVSHCFHCFPIYGWGQGVAIIHPTTVHSTGTEVLWFSAFSMVQLSHPYMTTGKTIALTRPTFVRKIMSGF